MIKVVGSVDTEMALDEATAYSKGYIQALEDAITDIYHYVHLSKYATRIKSLLEENLADAKNTLEALEAIHHGSE